MDLQISQLDENIQIESAIYGVSGCTADVTAKVQEFADTGVLRFEVRNHILSVDKNLTVSYTKNGVALKKDVTERGFFEF